MIDPEPLRLGKRLATPDLARCGKEDLLLDSYVAQEPLTELERLPVEDIATLAHGKSTSSTRRTALITLIRCDAKWGAVFRLPGEVAFTPEQEQENARRVDRERQREGDLVARLYRVVETALKLGPVSPSRLRDHVTEIGIPKRRFEALIKTALDSGTLKVTSRPTGGRGVALGLGLDPCRTNGSDEP